MSKKLKSIIISGVVLVALAGLLVLLLNLPEQNANSSSEAEDPIHILIKEDVSMEIKNIKVTNEFGTYNIENQGKKNDITTYSIKELDGLNLLSDDLYSLALNRNSLATYFIVEDTSKGVAAFGLDNPRATLELEFPGNKYTVKLGNAGSDGSYIYAMIDDDKNIYAVPNTSVSYAFLKKETYINKQILPTVNFDDPTQIPTINEVSITRKDLPYKITVRKLNSEEIANNSNGQSPIKMSSPIDSLVSTDGSQKHIYDLFGLTGNDVIMGNPEAADLKKFGIIEDAPTLFMDFNSSTYTLIVGNGIDNDLDNNKETKIFDSYYVYVEENKIVYSIEAAKITWREVEAKDIMSSIALINYIGDLANVEVNIDKKNYKFDLTHTYKDGDVLDETIVKYNGKELDSANFKFLLQLMLDSPTEDIYFGEDVKNEPSIKIQYNYSDNKRKSDTIEIIPNSVRTAIIAVNGDQKFIARIAYGEKLAKEIKNLIEGKDVSNEW